MDVNAEEHTEQVRAQFGRAARAYVESPGHAAGPDLERLVRICEAGPATRALDVATGGGHTALAVSPLAGRVTAVDVTPAMLEAAKEHARSRGAANVDFHLAEAEHLPFGNEAFDLVTCRIAPHHFHDVHAFLGEVARVLRPGGVFVLVDSAAMPQPDLDVFINRVEWLRDPTHVRSYSELEWRAWIRRAGLWVEYGEWFQKRHDFADWTARSQTPPEVMPDLVSTFLRAPDHVRSHFNVETRDGDVVSFTHDQLLLKARKPSA
ncbi:MAG TPA: class I SAM-dependent methyltransferase [Dehalococcoidia bacterium]